MDIILASKSPRRRELLSLLQIDFRLMSKEVEEYIDESEDLEEEIKALALKKAEAVATDNHGSLVIGADTIVVLGQKVFGKPKNEEEAFSMLKALSGKSHQVFTAVAIIFDGKTETFCSKTEVTFQELSFEEIEEYIKTKEPMDKAGAYGIQGYGAKFISNINGDYYSVMGLPISLVYQRIKKFF